MAQFLGLEVVENSQELASALNNRSNFGTLKKGSLVLSLAEGLFLLEKEKIKVYKNKKELTFDSFLKEATKRDKDFNLRYKVYKDLRERGYVTKTALKYGADYRVYPKGFKVGEDHAKWVVFCVHESGKFNWKNFASMARVAHSVKKSLLIAVVDDESDVTYYEANWMRA